MPRSKTFFAQYEPFEQTVFDEFRETPDTSNTMILNEEILRIDVDWDEIDLITVIDESHPITVIDHLRFNAMISWTQPAVWLIDVKTRTWALRAAHILQDSLGNTLVVDTSLID